MLTSATKIEEGEKVKNFNTLNKELSYSVYYEHDCLGIFLNIYELVKNPDTKT